MTSLSLTWTKKGAVSPEMPRATQIESDDLVAIKTVLSSALRKRVRQPGGSISRLARELGTSRTVVQRTLDPKNGSITLRTMVKTANRIGYNVKLVMEPRIDLVEKVEPPPEVQPLMEALGNALDRMIP